MSQRIRGKEVELKVTVDGVLRNGLFKNATEFEATPKHDLPETEIIGQDETALDFIASGWELSWQAQEEDADAADFVDELVAGQENRLPLPKITITVTKRYRDPSIRDRMYVYRRCVIMQSRDGAGSRTDYVSGSYTAKSPKRSSITL